MWWGVAAGADARGAPLPAWLWIAAVAPALVALFSFLPWLYGHLWPGPSLVVLGLAIVVSPLVDRRLAGAVPRWWMPLRLRLSIGLGLASIALGLH